MKSLLTIAALFFLAVGVCLADDPGVRDTLFMETVYAELGDTAVDVRAFVFCDDSVGFYNFPLTCNSICDSNSIYLTQVSYHNTLTLWDDCYDSLLCNEGFMRMVGWFDICGDDNPELFAPYRLLCWTFHFTIDSSTVPQIVSIDTTYDPMNGSLLFGLSGGVISLIPVFVPGAIYYGITSGIEGTEPGLPTELALNGSYPNPFNPTTTLSYSLPKSSQISIAIYNILGQKAATLFEGEKPAGSYTITWNASSYPSGVYFARLETEGSSRSIKMVLLK